MKSSLIWKADSWSFLVGPKNKIKQNKRRLGCYLDVVVKKVVVVQEKFKVGGI